MWHWGGRYVTFIGLNPSRADELDDDATIRRCIVFAKDWGLDGLLMVNLFALRSTDPKGLLAPGIDPIGPRNDQAILACARRSQLVIAAWGAPGGYLDRDQAVLALLGKYRIPVHCLGVTAAGRPRHPLRLPANTTPVPFAKSA